MGCSFSLIALHSWVRHSRRAVFAKGMIKETSKNEICPKPHPSPPSSYVEAFLHKSGGLCLSQHCLSCVTLNSHPKVCWDALTPRVQRQICEQCKGGKRACGSLDFSAVSLSSQPLQPDRISGAWSEEREEACRSALGMCEFQWQGWSRGRDGPEALSAFHSLQKNEEMRSQAQFAVVLFPKIILACSKICIEIPAVFFN